MKKQVQIHWYTLSGLIEETERIGANTLYNEALYWGRFIDIPSNHYVSTHCKIPVKPVKDYCIIY